MPKGFVVPLDDTASNGHHPTSKLDRLIAYHEAALRSLKFTKALLTEDAQASATRRSQATIDQALTLDATRRSAKKQKRGWKPKTSYGSAKNLKARRTTSAEFLMKFDTTEPRAGTSWRGLGPLVRRGYLKKKGDGYVRTGKEYRI